MELQKKPRLWTGAFVCICCMSLMTGLVMRLLDNTLAIYANDLFGSKSYGGLLTTFHTLGSFIMSAVSGRLIDKYGRRGALIIGCAVFAASLAVCIFVTEPAVVLASRFVQGMGRSLAMVSTAAIAADITPKERMNEGLGMYGMGNTLSNAFGPALGLWMLDVTTYGVIFGTSAGLYIVVMMIGVFLKYEQKGVGGDGAPVHEDHPEKLRGGLLRFFEVGAFPSTAVQLTFSTGIAVVVIYLTIYMSEGVGMDSGKIAYFFTVAAAGMIVARLFAGRLSDRFGAFVVLFPGAIMLIATLVILGFFVTKDTYALYLFSGLLYGLSQATVYPALQATCVLDSPSWRRGAASSTLFFGLDVGMFLGSACYGFIIDAQEVVLVGYRNAFAVAIACVGVSFIFICTMMNNKARRRHVERQARKLEALNK